MLVAVFHQQLKELEANEAQQKLINALTVLTRAACPETDHKANWVAGASLLWPDAPEEVIGNFDLSVYKDSCERLVEHMRIRFEKGDVQAALSAGVDYLACCATAWAKDCKKIPTVFDDSEVVSAIVFDDSEAVGTAGATDAKAVIAACDEEVDAIDENAPEDGFVSRYSGAAFVAGQLRSKSDNSADA